LRLEWQSFQLLIEISKEKKLVQKFAEQRQGLFKIINDSKLDEDVIAIKHGSFYKIFQETLALSV